MAKKTKKKSTKLGATKTARAGSMKMARTAYK